MDQFQTETKTPGNDKCLPMRSERVTLLVTRSCGGTRTTNRPVYRANSERMTAPSACIANSRRFQSRATARYVIRKCISSGDAVHVQFVDLCELSLSLLPLPPAQAPSPPPQEKGSEKRTTHGDPVPVQKPIAYKDTVVQTNQT